MTRALLILSAVTAAAVVALFAALHVLGDDDPDLTAWTHPRSNNP